MYHPAPARIVKLPTPVHASPKQPGFRVGRGNNATTFSLEHLSSVDGDPIIHVHPPRNPTFNILVNTPRCSNYWGGKQEIIHHGRESPTLICPQGGEPADKVICITMDTSQNEWIQIFIPGRGKCKVAAVQSLATGQLKTSTPVAVFLVSYHQRANWVDSSLLESIRHSYSEIVASYP